MPEWRGLISWADDWWYGNGSDMTSHRMSDVTAFVQSASQLAVERYGEESHSYRWLVHGDEVVQDRVLAIRSA